MVWFKESSSKIFIVNNDEDVKNAIGLFEDESATPCAWNNTQVNNLILGGGLMYPGILVLLWENYLDEDCSSGCGLKDVDTILEGEYFPAVHILQSERDLLANAVEDPVQLELPLDTCPLLG